MLITIIQNLLQVPVTVLLLLGDFAPNHYYFELCCVFSVSRIIYYDIAFGEVVFLEQLLDVHLICLQRLHITKVNLKHLFPLGHRKVNLGPLHLHAFVSKVDFAILEGLQG